MVQRGGTPDINPRGSAAVIGSGIAGLTAAYVLQRRYDVTLFEQEPYLGGHANTRDLPAPGGRLVPVDTGFIVHNDQTYPHLVRLFSELGVVTQPSEMSMSIRCDECGLQYAGGRGLRGILATPSALRLPRFLRLLIEVRRFHLAASRLLAEPEGELMTLGEFLRAGHYSRFFATHFLLPLVSAVWSSGTADARLYPAHYLFRFLAHHGMLSVAGSHAWRTVVGGARSYVDRAVKELAVVAINTQVRALTRHADGVDVRDDADKLSRYDRVVVAAHADQALALLADSTPRERAVLGAFRYSRNEAVVHTDTRALPTREAALSSWNYRMTRCTPTSAEEHRTQLSYYMNRLQRIDEPVDYIVTLNDDHNIAPDTIIERMVYQHPVYTRESVAAQAQLDALATRRTVFAGAYHGWGFHEDGCVSGVRAAAAFGVDWSTRPLQARTWPTIDDASRPPTPTGPDTPSENRPNGAAR